MMKSRRIDEEIVLVPCYRNSQTALGWYQDCELCRQVDNRDTVYDSGLLKRMYSCLNTHGDLFRISYKDRLRGDVCRQYSGEINIVIAKPYQNRHIGRRAVNGLVPLAGEKGIQELHARIDDFHVQSQKMFRSIGFPKAADEQYLLTL